MKKRYIQIICFFWNRFLLGWIGYGNVLTVVNTHFSSARSYIWGAENLRDPSPLGQSTITITSCFQGQGGLGG